MSVWSDAGNATLGEVIDHLSALPADQVVDHGFNNPHSYRGYYDQLAFEPCENTTVGAMLACAEAALGGTFQGYKGGDYTMDRDTDCWLARYGSTGVAIVLPDGPNLYYLPRRDEA